MYVSVLVIPYPGTPDALPGAMQAVLPQILEGGRMQEGTCFPVAMTKGRGSFGGLFVSVQGGEGLKRGTRI